MIFIKVKKEKLVLAASSVFIFIGIALVPQVLADELVISDNGANSTSEVHATVSSDTTVRQNNDANVLNDVKVKENTGNNSASENAGGSTSVVTGDANSSTSVSNSANVSSVNLQNCNCASNGSVTIIGNGAYSDNKVHVNSSAKTTVLVDQNARIRNNLSEDLITGKNKANDNTDGDVSISTGNIRSRTNLFNDLLNFSDIKVAYGPLHDFLLKVLGNGAFSDNKVKAHFDNDNTVFVNNALDLINNLKHRYVTGENDANSNTGGDVNIATGDIDSEVNVKNVANISKVAIECNCETPTPSPVPTSVPTPTNSPTVTPTAATPTPASNAAAATPTSSPEKVLGAAAEILPVTGSNAFFFMLIGSIVMMLMGAYLRLRSGRSPGLQI